MKKENPTNAEPYKWLSGSLSSFTSNSRIFFVSEVYTSFSKYDVNNNETVNGSSERLVANELFYMYHHMYKEPDYR